MIPRDQELYDKVKKELYKKYPKHSAYRSGLLVKEYKNKYKNKYKINRPYIGNKTNNGLTRWFKEKWRNQRGNIGYKYKNDIYRPTIKVNKYTPKLLKNISNKTMKKVRKMKYNLGRVLKF